MQKTILAVISFGVIAQYIAAKIFIFTGSMSNTGMIMILLYTILVMALASNYRKSITEKMDEAVWFLLLISIFLLMGAFGLIGAVIGLLCDDLVEAMRLSVKVQGVVLIFYAPVVVFAYFFTAKPQGRATRT